MSFGFEWNAFADQPHNVAPRSERMKHHLRRWPGYLALLGLNAGWAPRIFGRYRRHRRNSFGRPVEIKPEMFGLAVSARLDHPGEADEVIRLLRESGARQTLFRLPSWEKERLARYESFARRLGDENFGLAAALLQRREDVCAPAGWSSFVSEAFERIGPVCPYFEVGHAWNRTKWGVWDHDEYLDLARAAVSARLRTGASSVKLVGPAVIDFEFHLYPPVLRAVEFDVVSSLLYVDRVGAPENAQHGFTAAKKIALFRAYADVLTRHPVPAWITEFNWPLENTGPWSPASGKPNVSERDQADFLVRYYVIALASGLIDRAYWWQLAAPGYGLVDTRESPWRKRPSYFAFSFLVRMLTGGVFVGKEKTYPADGRPERSVETYHFRKDGREFALAWTLGGPALRLFDRPIGDVLDRDGKPSVRDRNERAVHLDGSPRYILFD
jgi:hypothetical protein